MNKKMLQGVGLCSCAVFVAVLVAGCTTAARQGAGVGLVDSFKLAKLTRQEYQILDTVEGVGKTTTVLGITFPLFHRQWGYTVMEQGTSLPFAFGGGFFGGGVAKMAGARAMYDALSKSPNADAVYTMSKTVERRGIPYLFHVDSAMVKGKPIKIMTDQELGALNK